MRTGACTIQQALTAEAATVLKLSLNLARRRGHAQVTPLHVAATLLTSSSSSSSSSSPPFPCSNLLRRACLKSHPHHPASHPLQCRALELCFNVALNRLPTTPPPPPPSSSTSSSCSSTTTTTAAAAAAAANSLIIHSHPTLSNALIAALKRAQAHQRRGCIELQQQQQQQLSPQSPQPLLAIKVELEQLIISILDDPSVSRVMREAGFSSTSVKSNFEEQSSSSSSSSCSSSVSLAHSSPSSSPSPPFYFDPQGCFWQAQFLKPSSEPNNHCSSQSEDLRLLLEVLVRKQGRRMRRSVVVVGDSAPTNESLVSELMRRVERGDVPNELKPSSFIKFQLSYLHLRLMSRGDVDTKVSELKRKVLSSSALESGSGGSGGSGGGCVIIYVGDLRWVVDGEAKDGEWGGVEYMVEEVGRMLGEVNNGSPNNVPNNRVWVLATSCYSTYMRCQMRKHSLEAQWALQPVMVPSGGLALSLQAPTR